jgi:hypothetical protein
MVSTFRTPAARLVAALGLSLSIVVPPLTLRGSSQASLTVAAAVPDAVAHTITWAGPQIVERVAPRTRRLASVPAPRVQAPTSAAPTVVAAPTKPTAPAPVRAPSPPPPPAPVSPPAPAPPAASPPPAPSPAAAPAPSPAPSPAPAPPPPPASPPSPRYSSAPVQTANDRSNREGDHPNDHSPRTPVSVPVPTPPPAPNPQPTCPSDNTQNGKSSENQDHEHGNGPPSVPPGQAKKHE